MANEKKRKQAKKIYDLQNRRRRKLGKYEAVSLSSRQWRIHIDTSTCLFCFVMYHNCSCTDSLLSDSIAISLLSKDRIEVFGNKFINNHKPIIHLDE